jgi:RNA polymerase sigma factor (sigma-70 family)
MDEHVPSSIELLKQWQAGDQRAAHELYNRYGQRLMALVGSRLSPQLAPRLDAEDVVQSAYRSFFVRARDGRIVLERAGDLWQLLLAITLNKLHRLVKHHQAKKRAVGREQAEGRQAPRTAPEPAYDSFTVEALALAEALAKIRQTSTAVDFRVVELRLQGYTVEEIAAEMQRGERTVRRVLERTKLQLEQWYGEGTGS